MNEPYSIQYPRKNILRAILKGLARLLLPILCRVEVIGLSRIPKSGPVILAGNHVAAMEIVMMLAYAPKQVEFVGAGDIPLDPALSPYANLYGFIPLKRGMVDRASMRAARDVLVQRGYLVMFPEGGIWDPAGMNARVGVAWLSQEVQAPVVPVGFGGVQGALVKMMKFQRPQLSMHVGEPIAAVSMARKGENRRATLEQFASEISKQIQALIPDRERENRPPRIDERYDLRVITRAKGAEIDHTAQFSLSQQDALSHFLCQPVLLDTLRKNLRLGVGALQHLDQITDAEAIATAVQAVIHYLDNNPGFLTYRFGVNEGLAAAEGLRLLHSIASQAVQNQQSVAVFAERRYRLGLNGEEVREPYGQRTGVSW